MLNLSVLLFVGMLLLVWKASTPLALTILVGTNIVLLVGMWKFSSIFIPKLIYAR
ncbi:MAG: hypothetical protein NVS4B12_14630 [Ktedonobacteraceae bacterium]